MTSLRFNAKNFIYACCIPILVLMIHNVVYLAAALGYRMRSLETNDADIGYLASFVSYGLCIVLFGGMYCFFLHRKSDREDFSDLPASHPAVWLKRIFSCVLLVLWGFVLQFIVSSILNVMYFYHPEWLASYQDMIQTSFSLENGALRIFTVMLLAPVAEELAFRGVMLTLAMRAFCGKRSACYSVLLVSVCFGLYHGNLVQFIYATIIGLILGTLAARSKGLLYPIVLHVSVNVSAYVLPILLSYF